MSIKLLILCLALWLIAFVGCSRRAGIAERAVDYGTVINSTGISPATVAIRRGGRVLLVAGDSVAPEDPGEAWQGEVRRR